MGTTTNIAIVPKSRMDDFCVRFGGFTWQAEQEVVGLPRGGDGEILKRTPRVGDVLRDDGRYRTRAFRAIEAAYGSSGMDDKRTLLLALSFWWPVTGVIYPHFNDAGGTAPNCGPVLRPERCRHLLDCWLAVDAIKFHQALDRCTRLWDSGSEDFCMGFADGKSVYEYLNSFAGFLGESISRDSFYTCTTY
jgi:hypothetical protein